MDSGEATGKDFEEGSVTGVDLRPQLGKGATHHTPPFGTIGATAARPGRFTEADRSTNADADGETAITPRRYLAGVTSGEEHVGVR